MSLLLNNLKDAASLMNGFGKNSKPFFFMMDFLGENVEIQPQNAQNKILFNINGISNIDSTLYKPFSQRPKFELKPVDFATYKQAFDLVQKNLHQGNSFLANLTFPTPVSTDTDLETIFYASKAKYRVYYPNKFVCFSPETFVRIENGIISSNPMKGTISASIPNAEQLILADQKELAEHTTIVDLIRNDLSMVASKVKVEAFRYIEKLTTNRGDILQVSSKISGKLTSGYQAQIGTIICKLLPAGSISGAPKPKTIDIILQAENYKRGFYTGICGFFDGKNLDSAVMIRFIENTKNGLSFKSGGGITAMSKAKEEYNEMISKVYLPS